MHTWYVYCPRPKTSNDWSKRQSGWYHASGDTVPAFSSSFFRRKWGRVSCLAWYQPFLTFRSVVWRLGPGTVLNHIELSCQEASGGNLSPALLLFYFLRQWFVLSKNVSECFSIYSLVCYFGSKYLSLGPSCGHNNGCIKNFQ